MSLSKWSTSATALALLFFVGCTDTATEPVANTDQAADASGADAGDVLGEPADSDAHDHADHDNEGDTAAAATDDGMADADGYLALPDGMPPGADQAYEQVLEQAKTGAEMGLLNMAGISQQIGMEISRSDAKAGNAFYKQSATVLRKALKSTTQELPPAFVGQVFYNEACALAVDGDFDAASKSLEEALAAGFADFDQLRSNPDLETVRAVAGFEERLKEREVAALEKAREHAKEELANGESFPFEFALADIDGNEQNLASYKGKVVIVDIWGTWCPPCREEIPSFIKLQDKFGDQGFQMLGLNYERGQSEEANIQLVVDYAKKAGINYPCIMGDEETRSQVPDFGGFPTTMFIDKAGKVRLKAVGLHDYAYLDAIVSELLAEDTPADLNAK